jgi:hypothetical protein
LAHQIVKMPGIVLPQRRPRDEEEEESDEGSQSSKRARLTPDEDDEESDAGTVSGDKLRLSVQSNTNHQSGRRRKPTPP